MATVSSWYEDIVAYKPKIFTPWPLKRERADEPDQQAWAN